MPKRNLGFAVDKKCADSLAESTHALENDVLDLVPDALDNSYESVVEHVAERPSGLFQENSMSLVGQDYGQEPRGFRRNTRRGLRD